MMTMAVIKVEVTSGKLKVAVQFTVIMAFKVIRAT